MMLYFSGLILLPFLFLLISLGYIKRKNFDTTHSIIYYFIIFGFFAEISMRLCALCFKNNTPLYNLISLIEFLFFFCFYYKFIGNRLNKFSYLLIFFIFLSVYFYELINNGVFSVPSLSILCKNVLLIVLSIIAFRKIINVPQDSIITDYSIFWINSAILVYYTDTLFIFGLRKYTLQLHALTIVTIYLHLFFIFVFYGLLSIGLWKTSKKKIL